MRPISYLDDSFSILTPLFSL